MASEPLQEFLLLRISVFRVLPCIIKSLLSIRLKTRRFGPHEIFFWFLFLVVFLCLVFGLFFLFFFFFFFFFFGFFGFVFFFFFLGPPPPLE